MINHVNDTKHRICEGLIVGLLLGTIGYVGARHLDRGNERKQYMKSLKMAIYHDFVQENDRKIIAKYDTNKDNKLTIGEICELFQNYQLSKKD